MDPTVQYLVSHPDQPIVHDGLVITERAKDRHVYYDWHSRHSPTRFRMVGQARPAANVQAGVALHRDRCTGRYEPGDVSRFAFLHRHLQRALTIGYRLGTLGTMQQATAEVLDRNPSAVVLLDDQRRVVYTNRSASLLKATADGIAIDVTGLVLADRQSHTQLQLHVAQAFSPDATQPSVAGVMRASRPSGKRPYSILVAPVSARLPALSTVRPVVCVIITDPERPSATALIKTLQAAFRLTEAEARLAERLARGDDLRSAARSVGVTYQTARTRLAEIFQKTDTHRQAELVSLLLTVVAMTQS
jgi:DNA-binding CsgD family transcriptional regulator